MSNREPSEAGALASSGARSARKQHARALFRALPQRYDRLSAAFSFGQDPRWRRALVDAIAPRDGECVLDVATGTELLAAARMRFQSQSAVDARIKLIEAQAESLPFAARSFDALTFTYLLRYVD